LLAGGGVAMGDRSFEIALARAVAGGKEETAWFTRHGATPERPEYKRRWAQESWEKRQERALRDWLLERLEDRRFWFDPQGRPRPRSVAQLADEVSRDPDLVSVLALWEGRPDIPVSQSLVRLLADEAVPFLAAYRYKETGLRKREAWEETWALQRREDAGERVGAIPVPPKYAPAELGRLLPGAAHGPCRPGQPDHSRTRRLATDRPGSRTQGGSVKHLLPLLDRARYAGRTVIITADHGHVVERRQGIQRSYPDTSSGRSRAANPPAGEGEILVAGHRVLLHDGRAVLAVDERLRYGPLKAGYHGGGSPAEAVVAVAVLVCGAVPDGSGLELAPPQEPAWWTDPVVARPVVAGERGRGRADRPQQQAALGIRLRSAPGAAPTLFDLPGAEAELSPASQVSAAAEAGPAVPGKTAAETVIGSAAYAAQRRIAGRLSVPDDRVRDLLSFADDGSVRPALAGTGRGRAGCGASRAAGSHPARAAAAERGGLRRAEGRRRRRDGDPGRAVAPGAVRGPDVTA